MDEVAPILLFYIVLIFIVVLVAINRTKKNRKKAEIKKIVAKSKKRVPEPYNPPMPETYDDKEFTETGAENNLYTDDHTFMSILLYNPKSNVWVCRNCESENDLSSDICSVCSSKRM